MIHIYYGDGKGKTTAAIGLAVRMAGHNKRVLFIQFLKGGETGETKLLSEYMEVLRLDKSYGFSSTMRKDEREAVAKCHNENLNRAIAAMNKYDMIVLDEVFDACNMGLLDKETLKSLVADYSGELVMTGHRDIDEWFLKIADYITEVKKIKHPFDRGITARKGIEW